MSGISKKKLDILQNKACDIIRSNPALGYKAVSEKLSLPENTVGQWYRRDTNDFKNKWDSALKDAFNRLEGLAIQTMADLLVDGNFNAAKYVLDNRGYKPADKLDANINGGLDFEINIGD